MVGAGQEEQHREMPGDESESRIQESKMLRVGGEGGEGQSVETCMIFCAKSPKAVVSWRTRDTAWLLIAVNGRFQGCPRKAFPSDIILSRKESQVCMLSNYTQVHVPWCVQRCLLWVRLGKECALHS